MVEALKTQEQDRAINELSFLERLALLVDQQWTWRENQALARRLKAAKLRGPVCVEPGQDGNACSGKRLGLGPQPREHFRVGSERRGQEFYRFGSGPKSLSRRPLGSLSASCRLASGVGPSPSGWQLA